MTTLLIDALIAIVKLTDRGLTAAENVLRFRPSPLGPSDGEAPPVGVDSAVAASAHDSGGHPGDVPDWHPASWPDSQLLSAAAELLCWIGSHPGLGPRSREGADNIRRELNHRAAQFQAQND